jgi:hypothetical protein
LIPDLKLNHPRRIDIRETRDRIRRAPDADHLAKRWIHGRRVPIRCLGPAEDIAVVEEIEHFSAKQNRSA